MDIIYSDRDIIVINKPPGINMHSGGSVFGRTVAGELLERFPEIAGVGEDAARPGIVHRLDRDTSGVLVVARRRESFAALKDLFHRRLVEKMYLAIVCGTPREREGKIDMSIGRLASNPVKRGVASARREIRGAREAHTEYRVLKSGGGYSLVELRPRTGRMHQLRVHIAALGHPVACDRKYGGKNVCCPTWKQGFHLETLFPSGDVGIAGVHLLPAKPSRQLLHAQSLSFTYPEGRRNFFEADPPEDFALALKTLY